MMLLLVCYNMAEKSSIQAVLYLSVCFVLIYIIILWTSYCTVKTMPVPYSGEFDIQYEFHQKSNHTSVSYGFLLADNFAGQLTGSSANLVTLQCWASVLQKDSVRTRRQIHMFSGRYKVLVVEPFIRNGSIFGVDFKRLTSVLHAQPNSVDSFLTMGDLLDKRYWQQYTSKLGYSPLVTWGYFLKHAPRKLIIVYNQFDCPSPVHCEQFESFHLFAEIYGFEVVRTAHYDTRKDLFTAEKFKKLVYGEHSPSETVVLFNKWGGISKVGFREWRIPISDLQYTCNSMRYFDDPFHHSESVIIDAKTYVDKYMPEANKNGYIAVMLRLEHFRNHHGLIKHGTPEELFERYMGCISKTLAEVRDMRRKYKIDSTFLAMDLGKHGSEVFRHDKDLINTIAHNFYKGLFGNSSTLSEWEQSFDDVSRFSEPGYVAMVQKIIAANSTCLLTAGGGRFQGSATQLYEKYHSVSSSCSVKLKF